MSWDLDAMSVLPADIEQDVYDNFTPEYLAEKLSAYVCELQSACIAILECTGGSANWDGETHDALKKIEHAMRS